MVTETPKPVGTDGADVTVTANAVLYDEFPQALTERTVKLPFVVAVRVALIPLGLPVAVIVPVPL